MQMRDEMMVRVHIVLSSEMTMEISYVTMKIHVQMIQVIRVHRTVVHENIQILWVEVVCVRLLDCYHDLNDVMWLLHVEKVQHMTIH